MAQSEPEIRNPVAAPSKDLVPHQSLPAPVAILFQVAAATVPVVGGVWFIGCLMGAQYQTAVKAVLCISIAAATLTACFGVWIQKHLWSRPTRALLNAILDARDGEVSIETLSKIGGGIAPLIPVIQDLLRIIKKQRADLSANEQEIRGRVASRTDALERKIGSLQHQAMRDVLTGLFNRRSLEQEMPRLLSDYKAGGHDACLLMIDIDHFKLLNDALGHAAGDRLLKEIGQIIRSTIGDDDFAFRCGGDEFIILMQGATAERAEDIRRRLMSLVEVLARPLRLPSPPQLSIGVCLLSEMKEASVRRWLETADQRLYAVKTARKGGKTGARAAMKKTA